MSFAEEIIESTSEYLLDLSFLLNLGRFPVTAPESGIRLLVPSVVEHLPEFDPETLDEVDRYFGQTFFFERRRPFDPYLLRENLDRLRSMGMLRFLPEESPDEEIEAVINEALPPPRRRISWIAAGFVRDYLVSMLSRARRAGTPILMKTRRLPTLLREKVAVLELPSRADRFVDSKSRFVQRVFGFPGGRAAKVFVGILVSGAGIVYLPFGVVGLVLAFADP